MHQDIFEEFPLLDIWSITRLDFTKYLPRNYGALEFIEKAHKSINNNLGGKEHISPLKILWTVCGIIWKKYE